MQGLIERYKGSNAETQVESSEQNKPHVSSRHRMIHLVISDDTVKLCIRNVIHQEVLILRQEIDLLQKGPRYMYGAKNMDHMNLHELQALESNLEIWVHNIRSRKMQIISGEIEMLRNKEGILKSTNDILQER